MRGIIKVLTTLGTALFSGLLLYMFGRRSGSNAQDVKQIEKRLDDAKTAEEVRSDVETLDGDNLTDRASRWVRDDNN